MEMLIEDKLKMDRETEPTDSKEIFRKMVTVYGNIELSGQEKKFLSFGPLFP